jgi:hypothetical protein
VRNRQLEKESPNTGTCKSEDESESEDESKSVNESKRRLKSYIEILHKIEREQEKEGAFKHKLIHIEIVYLRMCMRLP